VTVARSYLGLTWDHPRGYVALYRAADEARATGLDLTWKRQPLEGFESHPIEELAAAYDIIVLDHPHLGDAVSKNCLQPLSDIFSEADIEQWKSQSIGRSFDSYLYEGQNWALPLDAASQVAAVRVDLLPDNLPQTWSDVLELADQREVCLSLAGPHALLTLYSISASLGTSPCADGPNVLLPGPHPEQAWEILTELYAKSYKGWLERNPIAILDGMSRTDAVVYCPLVFGYVNYAASADSALHPLKFANVPAGPDGLLGSVLGGTGIGISKRCIVDDHLRDHLRHLMSLQTQKDFIPSADGQPSAREAWHTPAVNAKWNDFFEGTSKTLEEALVRPRHPGYVPFQDKASAIVRTALDGKHSASQVINAIQALYEALRPTGSTI
jgi:multiple sugar transport system substrate-binding protein